MKKILLSVIVSSIAVGFCTAAELVPSCKEYFEQIDKMVKESSSNPNVAEIAKMYEEQKKQFEQLPKDTQDNACKMALEQLKQTMQSMKQMAK